ncbi:MAG: queuosine salvage family protein, partial [Vicinamibacteria bacterium]
MVTRRDFLGLLAVPLWARPFSRLEGSSPGASPQGGITGHPILDTLAPVIEGARHVRFHDDKVRAVADWMAYEELPWPDFRSPLTPQEDSLVTMDFTFLTSTINFAFTDFESHTIFKAQYAGGEHWDSLGMEACLKRAHDEGVPILDGSWLAAVSREELDRIFTGNIPIPMLDERLAIFHEVGNVLKEKYNGRFHNFLKSSPSRLYADGDGLLERLLAEFPSFRDTSPYRGASIAFQKRAQLLWWQLHARFQQEGFFAIEDPEKLTVFADYIVPVAFRLFG